MNNFFFICYKSLFNLKMTLQFKVIGFGRVATIPANSELMMLYRKEKEWYVIGKCQFGELTEDNPFDEPERYPITYTVKDIVTCKPIPVNDILRKQAGQYWGLLLQHSMKVDDPVVVKYINENFVPDENVINSIED